MKLDQLLSAVNPDSLPGSAGIVVSGVSCDSRCVKSGHVFVAVAGTQCEGRTFVDDALQRGAVAIVSEHDDLIGGGVFRVRVPDARAAYALMSAEFHGRPSGRLSIAGVTGTNGKTTLAFMLRDILESAGRRCGLIGTVEYRIGERSIPAGRTTPDAGCLQGLLSQMVAAGCQAASMEVSSHALDQKRVLGVDFDVGVFTNLTRDHLDYHLTFEAYYEAKRRLFTGLGRGGKRATAVINADDAWGCRLLADPDVVAPRVSFGLTAAAEVRATEIRLSAEGSTFRVESPWGAAPVRLRLLGRFNVSNALAAIGAACAMGVPLETILAALGGMQTVPGRMEAIPNNRGIHIYVDYAHTDDALSNVLMTLREIAPRRLLLVFGCGGNRDRTKRPVMGRVAASLADYTILTSDNPRKEDPAAILSEIEAGFGSAGKHEVVENRVEAIRRAIEIAQADDIVLIAGKGHEGFQEVGSTIIPHDDRVVARRLL
jgi:UDP-N-acetylmuramoyl-L-alanyl-D-glutamate--2,6-diaminopimelate ligase